MSIWCNRPEIGYDTFPGGYLKWREWPNVGRGEVWSYANGWSNHYPTTDGTVERPAAVNISNVPIWCVPGHADDYSDAVGTWVRLDVTFWDGYGDNAEGPWTRCVLLDEQAARSLATDLLAWADEDHVTPKETE